VRVHAEVILWLIVWTYKGSVRCSYSGLLNAKNAKGFFAGKEFRKAGFNAEVFLWLMFGAYAGSVRLNLCGILTQRTLRDSLQM